VLNAGRAKRVLEAQFQDGARMLLDELYTKFVDAQEAQEKSRRARAAAEELGRLLGVTVSQAKTGLRSQADVARVKSARAIAESRFEAAVNELERTKHALGALVKLSPGEVDRLEVVGLLDVRPDPLPAVEELIRVALDARPDIGSYRLGLQRSQADLAMARPEGRRDAYTLFQPYTLNDKAPSEPNRNTSFSIAVTVPVPVHDANSGGLQRAKLNIEQTRRQLTALEREVTSDVKRARGECDLALAAVKEIERDELSVAQAECDKATTFFEDGKGDVATVLGARANYRDVESRYIDLLVRFRRSSLKLNTAVAKAVIR
jgi:cobalt-zinc-cadmium efflux system outer membrane protein